MQAPLFAIVDDAVAPLAHYTATGEVAVGYRENSQGGRTFYSAVGNMPHRLLRRIARLAGVHITFSGQDPIYENSALLGIHAQSGGEYRFDLARDRRLEELFGHTHHATKNGQLTCTLEKGATYLFLKEASP